MILNPNKRGHQEYKSIRHVVIPIKFHNLVAHHKANLF